MFISCRLAKCCSVEFDDSSVYIVLGRFVVSLALSTSIPLHLKTDFQFFRFEKNPRL